MSEEPDPSGKETFTRTKLDPALLRPSGALLGAHIAVAAAIDEHAVAVTGHDPTTLDLLTRLALTEGNQLRAVELCRQLRLSPSHVSRMLDRAEAAGLVRREPDPDDRRAHQIAVTPHGWEVIDQFAPLLTAVLKEVVHGALAEDEIETLVALLGKIEQAAGDYPNHQAEPEV
ncbi:MAG: MarR family winged helix-turn-helix transcriptional regulator [Actinomycetota bacterium]